jgi:hypothetical protein
VKTIGGKMGFIDSNVMTEMCCGKRFLYRRRLLANLIFLQLYFRGVYYINFSSYELKNIFEVGELKFHLNFDP